MMPVAPMGLLPLVLGVDAQQRMGLLPLVLEVMVTLLAVVVVAHQHLSP